jgi:Tfp pilus assembly protein PilV
MMYKRRENHGFILADVTLGIFIITVGLLAISVLFTQSLQAEKIASDYTLAVNLVQKQLELLKNQSPIYWAELDLPCTIAWQDNTLPPPAIYEITTHAVISALDIHLVQVTVTAKWREKDKDYSIQVITFYSNIN